MRAVGGGRFAAAPELGQLELGVQVLQVGGARAQVRDVDVSAVDEAELVGSDITCEVPRGLCGPEAATVGEGRDHVAIMDVPDCRTESGRSSRKRNKRRTT